MAERSAVEKLASQIQIVNQQDAAHEQISA
jgi:hypothetical protein